MRIERDDGRHRVPGSLAVEVQHHVDDGLMAPVQSVEDADGDHRITRGQLRGLPSRTTIMSSNYPCVESSRGARTNSGFHESCRRCRIPTRLPAESIDAISSPEKVPSRVTR